MGDVHLTQGPSGCVYECAGDSCPSGWVVVPVRRVCGLTWLLRVDQARSRWKGTKDIIAQESAAEDGDIEGEINRERYKWIRSIEINEAPG